MTAGNASGINDAAAMLLMSAEQAKEMKLVHCGPDQHMHRRGKMGMAMVIER